MRLLVLSKYPAPYRIKLFNYFLKEFDAIVFFEYSRGDGRKAEWFEAGNYFLLDSDFGKKKYNEEMKRIRDYDLVAVYDYSTKESIKLILRCQRLDIPYIVNSDGAMLTEHGNAFKELVKSILLKKSALFFASGKSAKKYFLRYGAQEDKIVIHTFSTLEGNDILKRPLNRIEKEELRDTLDLPKNKKIAVAVGRFIPLKRYAELIMAWRMIGDDYFLLLIGGGEMESRYREIINTEHINNIMIRGFYPKDELFNYYKASDLFVHPTSYDVWGLVINEAMACGLPCIVSDRCVAGIELINEGVNGYLCETGHETDLCLKAKEVLDNDKVLFSVGEQAIKTIQPYTLENMAQIHISAIRSLNDELAKSRCFVRLECGYEKENTPPNV